MFFGTIMMMVTFGLFSIPIILTFYKMTAKVENPVNDTLYFWSWVGLFIAIGLIVYPRTLPERDRVSLEDNLIGPTLVANKEIWEFSEDLGVGIGGFMIFLLTGAVYVAMAAKKGAREAEARERDAVDESTLALAFLGRTWLNSHTSPNNSMDEARKSAAKMLLAKRNKK